MSFKKHDRQYDLVVFGATGYTGLMTAEHITAALPTDLRWAVAGRSADKLRAVVDGLRALSPDRPPPAVEVCGLGDGEVAALARRTFALVATVGPFARYGEPAFRACAEAGTHYFDCTGEAAWTLRMLRRYEAAARRSGACLFPQCGIESAPSDLMTFALGRRVRDELGALLGDVVVDIHELHSAPSGGTLATVLGLFEVFPIKEIAQSHKPYAMSPTANSTAAPAPSLWSRLTGVRSVPGLGLLTSSITAGTNAAIVQRSWGLFRQEAALQAHFYGPNFTYREFMRARSLLGGVAMHYGLLLGGLLLMFCPPFRSAMRRFVYKPGQGPDRDVAARDYIEFRGVAAPDGEASGKKQATIKTHYHGSMYYMTSMILAQAALTILQDDVKLEGGVYTPACLGQGLIDRVEENGFKFETRIVDL